MAVQNKTLLELKNAVKTEMQLDPGLISDDERTRFINDCITDLGVQGGFEKRVDLVFTDGFASLPDDFVELIALYRGDTILKPASTDYATIGYIPCFPQIELRPRTSETLSLWYEYHPSALTLDDQRPDIPYGYDNAIIDYAVARAHRKNGNIGLYREYMSAYEAKKYELYQHLTRLSNARVIPILNTESTETDSVSHSSTLII